jgi:hypothetical protein
MQTADLKSVGIIGAGRLGQAMAQTALRAGRQVVIANSRGPESLSSVVEALGDGLSAGTVKDAAAADVVVVAVMWPQVPQAVEGLDWEGRIVIPHQAGGQPVSFMSGDDAEAKSDVGALFEDAGFYVVDLGGLREGGQMQQVGAPLAGHNLIRLP